jgi:hypothetical protein
VSHEISRGGFRFTFETRDDAEAWLAAQAREATSRRPEVERSPEHNHVSRWACAQGEHGACNPSGTYPPFVHSYPARLACVPCSEPRWCECECHRYKPLTSREILALGGPEFAAALGHEVVE